MTNIIKLLILLSLIFSLIACSTESRPGPQTQQPNQPPQNQINGQIERHPQDSKIVEKENTANVNYNEMGKVMVLMYHQFVDKETNEWTRSFDNFRKDLQVLYDKGYRPVNLRDYIDGNIDVPAGYTPVVFTFDDGTSGQFNLIEKEGKLAANPKSAVGIMEEFSKTHPDFPLKGTFFINHTGFFHGKGTPQERLKYLVDKGFEIGNHTVNHANLRKVATAEGIQKEIGGHVKKTAELLPGYVEDELALPLGITSRKYPGFVEKGEYQGTKYQNRVILLVGSNPAPSPANKDINLLKLPRIRAMGYKPVANDMYHWLDYFDKNPEERYLSDGNKDTFTMPVKFKEQINGKLGKNVVFLK